MPEPTCICGHILSLHIPTGDQAASRCTKDGCDCRAYERPTPGTLYRPPPPPDPNYLHPNDPARN